MAAHHKWARRAHPKKGARWVTSRYYGKFCPSRDDKWVFCNRDTGAHLLRHSWTNIRRHVMVKAAASPDDPDLAGYWENRRRRTAPARRRNPQPARQASQRCPACGDLLIDATHLPASPEDWEHRRLSVTRQDIPRAASTAGTTLPPERTGPPSS